MGVRERENKLKTSARRTLERADALYLSTLDDCDGATALKRLMEWGRDLNSEINLNGLPIYTVENIPQIIERIHPVSESMPMTSVSSVSHWWDKCYHQIDHGGTERQEKDE